MVAPSRAAIFFFKNHGLEEEKRLKCRFSHYSSHTIWISRNDQESKAVISPLVSIVSFDRLHGCIWRWDISSAPCSKQTSYFCSCSRL